MPALLNGLAHQQVGEAKIVPPSLKFEVEIARGRRSSMDEMDRGGRHSVLACPDCGGVTWEIDEGRLSRTKFFCLQVSGWPIVSRDRAKVIALTEKQGAEPGFAELCRIRHMA